jgi:hypothetical protein
MTAALSACRPFAVFARSDAAASSTPALGGARIARCKAEVAR